MILIVPLLAFGSLSGCESPDANGKKLCQCWEVAIQDGFGQREQEHCTALESKLDEKYKDRPADLERRQKVTAKCLKSIEFKKRSKRKMVLVD